MVKASNSYRTRDYYKYYKLIKPINKEFHITRELYSKVLFDICGKIINVILDEGYIELPSRIGVIYLKRKEVKPEIKNGKFRYVAPVHWGKTLQLWKEDEEAKRNKQIIKVDPGNVYSIKYTRRYVNRRKMKYYSFEVVRAIKLNQLKNLAKNNSIKGMDYYNILKNKI